MTQTQTPKIKTHWLTVTIIALISLFVIFFVFQLFHSEKFVIIVSNQILEQLEELQPLRANDDIRDQKATQRIESRLIKKMELVLPKRSKSCNTDTPWLMGENTIKRDVFLTSQDCYAIRFILKKDAHIFLFSHNESKKVKRILTDNCDSKNHRLIKKNETITIPPITKGRKSIFSINKNTEEETLYLVAFTPDFDTSERSQKLNEIMTNCDKNYNADGVAFLQSLKNIKQRNPEFFDWKKFRFYH